MRIPVLNHGIICKILDFNATASRDDAEGVGMISVAAVAGEKPDWHIVVHLEMRAGAQVKQPRKVVLIGAQRLRADNHA